MCANYFVILAQQKLAERFGIEAATHLDRTELFPKRSAPAIVQRSDHSRELRLMRWGLLPAWAMCDDVQPQPFNARAETVATNTVFRDSLKRRRCLMLAQGFYEWKGEKGSKVRYAFTLPDDEPFAFSGIWNIRDELETRAHITTTPNTFMDDYHNRMPVILDPRDYGVWLEPTTKLTDLMNLLQPWPGELLATEAPREVKAGRGEP